MPKLTSIQSGGVYIRSSTTLTGATVNWCQLFENNQYKKQKYLTDKLKYKHQIANLYEEREVNIYGNKIVCGVNETQAFKKLQNDHHTDQICKICPEITYPQADNSTYSRRSCWSNDTCQIMNRCDTVQPSTGSNGVDRNLCPKRKIHQLEPRCRWDINTPFNNSAVRKKLGKSTARSNISARR